MIEDMLVLSTGHITEFTCNTVLPVHDGPVWQKGEYGWFVYVIEEGRDELPEDLRECMSMADRCNCQWIMFDRDADTIDGLPIYDW